MPTRPNVLPAADPAVRRTRRQALCAFAALAALLHLALLGAIDAGPGLGEARRATPPAPMRAWVSVRAVVREDGVEPSAAAPAVEPIVARAERRPPPEAAGSSREERKASARSLAVPAGTTATTLADGKLAPSPPVQSELPMPATSTASAASPAVDPPDTASAPEVVEPPAPAVVHVAHDTSRTAIAGLLAVGERPPPTYRVVLPAPVLLRYELRRGLLRGTGEISWRPAGERYVLQFEARLAGLTLLAQSSQGELGPLGLAPVRFVDQRVRKAARSVNFSRDSGTISFSAATHRWPLLPGSQDRLSWMIQLGGIVAADPSLASADRISMVLVSARGEAAVRTARFAGRESAETASGSVTALKFVVDGHSAYDGSFEIWLDPARGYLPVRAVSRSSGGDAEFELLLQRAHP